MYAGWWQCISTAAPTRSPGSCCAAARCSKPWPLMSGCSSPNTATVSGCACPRWPPELPIQSWQEHLLAGLNGLLHLQVLLTCSRLGLPSQSKYFSLLVQSLSTIVSAHLILSSLSAQVCTKAVLNSLAYAPLHSCTYWGQLVARFKP